MEAMALDPPTLLAAVEVLLPPAADAAVRVPDAEAVLVTVPAGTLDAPLMGLFVAVPLMPY